MAERNEEILVEVDDFKHAIAIGRDLDGLRACDALEVMAQWMATLREYYVGVGVAIGRDDT